MNTKDLEAKLSEEIQEATANDEILLLWEASQQKRRRQVSLDTG